MAFAAPQIKINIDIGEGYDDAALAPLADHVNIACGGHCGDTASIRQALNLAARYGLEAGAHPSYPDRENFGRQPMKIDTQALMDSIASQLDQIARLAQDAGITLTHVKPHGALYHALHRDFELAMAFVQTAPPALSIITMPGGQLARAGLSAGRTVLLEGYADRAYTANGSLADRSLAGALITDPNTAAHQFMALAAGARFSTIDGGELFFSDISTICIHSDTTSAASILKHLNSLRRSK